MYVRITQVDLLKFNNCKECTECCKKYFAPLILEDFEKVYRYFPILIAKLDYLKPVMLISNGSKCPYLKNDKCEIYDLRPPACRIYPYSPWYDDILIDLSCNGIGISGNFLPLKKKEFQNSDFYDERFENITEKIIFTSKWVQKHKLKYTGSKKGIKLYTVKNGNDKYYDMLKKSQKFLKNYFI